MGLDARCEKHDFGSGKHSFLRGRLIKGTKERHDRALRLTEALYIQVAQRRQNSLFFVLECMAALSAFSPVAQDGLSFNQQPSAHVLRFISKTV